MPSRRFGHYEVLDQLGRGGMGVVFRALDANLRREVALKVLPKEMAGDKVLVRRFIREARALARLRHPNLVQVYTVGEEAGQYYYAMELVDGKSLAEILKQRGPLSAQETADVLVQVLNGLGEVHKAGTLHRDVKPGNIMVDQSRRVVLMDFGLAKSAQEKSLTTDDLIIGTPDYMSPEQARGQGLGPPSDLYSLGVVMFHMLAGRPPFRGRSSIQVLQKHLREPAPDLAEVVPGVDPAIAAIVARLLAKSPAERYPNTESVIAALAKACPVQNEKTALTLPTAPAAQGTDFTHAETADLDATVTEADETRAPTVGAAPPKPSVASPSRGRNVYVLGGVALGLLLILLLVVGNNRRRKRDGDAVPPRVEAPVDIIFRDGRKVRGQLVEIDSDGFVIFTHEPSDERARHKRSEISEIVPLKPGDARGDD